jgi:hypothetical protein
VLKPAFFRHEADFNALFHGGGDASEHGEGTFDVPS